MKQLADVVAISVDSPSEAKKTEQLIGTAFPLLSDPDRQVINAYGMRHQMGGEVLGDMGYVIVGKDGRLMERVSDPLFGAHADVMITHLKANG